MLEANYSKPGVSNVPDNYLEKLSYDKNGNIQTLERNGGMDYNGGATVNKIDDLIYTYDTNNLNLLKKVSNPTTNNPQGFKDGTNTNDDFNYDAIGNMTLDNNKGITAIIYNHLNLPTKITFGANGTIEYIYNSVGQKLKKVVTDYASTPVTTDYLTGFQYKNSGLTLFPHAEGYVNFTASKLGTYKYVFNYTDHLGNVRLSYSLDNNALKILEENHYYAFGLKHTNYNNDGLVYQVDGNDNVTLTPVTPLAGSNYKYKFQEQERQEELGLNWDSFKWRNYDYAIGRFMSIDPLTEEYHTWSPYVFSGNRVIDSRELEGLEPYSVHATADAAWDNFGKHYNGESILINREIVSKIYTTTDESGNTYYTYAEPVIGGAAGADASKVVLPNGVKPVAIAHTHGAYDPNYANDEFSGVAGDPTSQGDMGVAERRSVDIYVATPNGSSLKYDVNTDKISILSTDMASDPKHPARLNNIDPKPIPPAVPSIPTPTTPTTPAPTTPAPTTPTPPKREENKL